MATIAEGLTLAQVTGQSQQTLLDILNQGQLSSIFLDQKCQSKAHSRRLPPLLQTGSTILSVTEHQQGGGSALLLASLKMIFLL